MEPKVRLDLISGYVKTSNRINTFDIAVLDNGRMEPELAVILIEKPELRDKLVEDGLLETKIATREEVEKIGGSVGDYDWNKSFFTARITTGYFTITELEQLNKR